jgi:16S rRNA (cytidine1402-2'-O)-methyltransferase
VKGAGVGTLFVVATPLGNAQDLSPRAASTLRDADVVIAEDTRTARRLLAEIGGATDGARAHAAHDRPVLSCYDANEAERAAEVAELLLQGKSVALVSEAGTPLVSDPGFRVVAAAIAAGARVVPIPGPSAILAALTAAGLPTDRFTFLGFPPRKSGARRRLFEGVGRLPFTLVLYESPMRTGATLADMAAVLGGGRRAVVARELTKPFEEIVRGTLGELAERYREDRPLGEITIVVEGAGDEAAAEEADMTDEELGTRAAEMLAGGASTRDAADRLATLTGRPRREVYRLIVAVAASPGRAARTP